MAIKFANNATSTLAGTLTDVATSFSVAAGEGARFPTLGGSDYFFATLVNGTTLEIVKVTARATDTFTVTRAQQGTAASAFPSGAGVELRHTYQGFYDLAGEREPTITAGTTAQYWRGDKSWQTLDKTAVGLANVENTALSTWTGSANIVTLGTVATGTWNATAIGNTKGGTGQNSSAWTGLAKVASGTWSAGVAGTDYLAPPSGTAILKANSGGALANATANTDYLAPALGNTAVSGAKTVTFNSQITVGTTTGSYTIDFVNGQKQKVTLTGNYTPTFSFPGPGHYQLVIVSASYSVTWPTPSATFQWLNATGAPTLNTGTYGGVVNFFYDGTMTLASYSKIGAV